jgi:hypothetical protein
LNLFPNYKLTSAVALSKDSGLRVSDLVQIQYQHVKDGIESEDGFGGFVLKVEKTDKIALVCYGPETTKYLRLWIPDLEKKLGRELNDNDFLYPHTKNKEMVGDKSDSDALDRMLNNQIARLGLKGEVSFNGMRYFFESNLETVLNMNIITTIQGKQIGNSTKHYSKHDIEEMMEIYKPAYKVLMVEEQGNTELKNQLAGQQEQIDNQNQLIADQITAYNKKMAEMEKEINQLRQQNEERGREQAKKELFGDETQVQPSG